MVKHTRFADQQLITIPTEVYPPTHSLTHTFTYSFVTGLALRTVGFLFERIRNLTSKTTSVTIKLSALEIYNEKITDLLKDIANNPNLLIHPSTHSLTHSHTHLLTYPLTHSLTQVHLNRKKTLGMHMVITWQSWILSTASRFLPSISSR